jgi:hypothetical protein
MQWLAVDPLDGSANIVFYDRRNDADNRKPMVVLARSTDGGKSFTNYVWDSNPFDPDEQFIGDYSGIAALGGKVYGIWARTPGAADKPDAASTETTKKVRDYVEVGVADFTK